MKNLFEADKRWIVNPFWFGFVSCVVFALIGNTLGPLVFPSFYEGSIPHILVEARRIHDASLSGATAGGGFSVFYLKHIYALTGIPSPAWGIPVLGVLAGVSFRLLASIFDLLGVRGRWWPLVFALWFAVTPSSHAWLLWLHNESFFVPGLLLLTWVLLSPEFKVKHATALGLGVWLVAGNSIFSLVPLSFGLMLALFVKMWGQLQGAWRLLVMLLALGSFFVFKPRLEPLSGEGLVRQHREYLAQHPDGALNYLTDSDRAGEKSVFAYLPGALRLSFLEPMLSYEGKVEGELRTVAIGLLKLEMLVFAFLLVIFLGSLRRVKSREVLICILIALPSLVYLGLVYPNLGILAKLRFPFLLLIKLATFAGLWSLQRTTWPGRILMWVDPPKKLRTPKRLVFLVPDDLTFITQRLVMGRAALEAGFEVHVVSADLGAVKKVEELGFIHHALSLNRGGLNPVKDAFAFLRLVFLLAKLRPDILHNVSIKPVIYGSTAGAIVGLSRIVDLVNGLGYAFEKKGFKGHLVNLVATALYRNALALPGIRVIFQNPDNRQHFLDNRLVAPEKTVLIRGSGVDMEKFKKTPLPNNTPPVVLFVGRLLWSKGIRELVAAARILREQKVDFRLVVVGEPDELNPESADLATIKAWEAEGLIEWKGKQTDMPGFYQSADIVCLPSYGEGLPLTLLEAASCGRPLVATDVPGCREVVQDGVNGYLVPVRDVKILAKSLTHLLTDKGLREKLGYASHKRVEAEFSAQIVSGKLQEVYSSLIAP